MLDVQCRNFRSLPCSENPTTPCAWPILSSMIFHIVHALRYVLYVHGRSSALTVYVHTLLEGVRGTGGCAVLCCAVQHSLCGTAIGASFGRRIWGSPPRSSWSRRRDFDFEGR